MKIRKIYYNQQKYNLSNIIYTFNYFDFFTRDFQNDSLL